MPSPVLIGHTYYLRIRVPSDISEKVKGKTINVPIGSKIKQVTPRDIIKVSLGTSDKHEAKKRFAMAQASLVSTWEALRRGPVLLSHKQLVALAGEIRAAFIQAFDNEPGTPEMWESVMQSNQAATQGRMTLVITKGDRKLHDMNLRFGGIVDSVLAAKGIILEPEQRGKLLTLTASALNEAAQINKAKASGDYSDTGETSKYPKLVSLMPDKPLDSRITFNQIIDRQVSLDADDTALLRTANKKSTSTIKKYRSVCSEFTQWRRSDLVATVTPMEVTRWMQQLHESGENSRTTIRLKAECLKAVCDWGQDHAKLDHSVLFEGGNPLEGMILPIRDSVDSSKRSYTVRQAKTVLLATRQSQAPETRWVPWLQAYTGMRVGDVAAITSDHFKEVKGKHFMLVQFQKTKTPRWIPLHSDVIKEGFLDFVAKSKGQLFRSRTQSLIWEWVNLTVLKDETDKPAPNHGWRNFMESLFELYNISPRAGLYLTGRALKDEAKELQKSSAIGYQVPDLALLTYAEEMEKIKPILEMEE